MVDDLNIVLHEECQLLDWGETRAGGPWVKLRLPDPELLNCFRGMDTATAKQTGHILHCTLAEGDIATVVDAEPDKGKHGKFWHDLIRHNVFAVKPVLQAIGTEEAFMLWLRGHPGGSAIDGNYDWDEQRGDKLCDPAHVLRTAEGSGKAVKSPYFAIPLTHEQHLVQHNKGEEACLSKFLKDPVDDAGKWFENKARFYRAEWASKTLAEQLAPGSTSRSQVHPDLVRDWFDDNLLTIYLPSKMRDDR